MKLPEPILIWGAGAIGGTIGAYLIRAGHQVIFVDNAPEHVEKINHSGLRINGPIAEFTVQAKAFTPHQLGGTFHTIFLAVKAHHTQQAVRDLVKHLAPDGFVVSAQNGLNELEIAKVVGEGRTMGCFVNFGADYLGPGLIHFAGRGAVVVGEIDGQMTERLGALHELMKDFEPGAIQTPNIWGYLWGKMAYGAQLFVTALTNASIADALNAPEHHQLFTDIAREVLKVAAAKGISPEGFNGFNPHAFTPDASDAMAAESIKEMVRHNRKSAKTHSGIWRDLAVRRRKTEVDAQLGPIVSIGKEVGVRAPITARMIEMIHEIEGGKRTLNWHNLAELSGGAMELKTVDDLPIATAAPGTVSRGYVRVEAGVSLELPFTVVQGAKPGPRLLVTGGIHGTEYASIEAAVRASHTDPGALSGTLVVLPIINFPAYRARSIYINPIDGKNLNRFFPGDPSGSYAEQLAYWLTEHAIKGSDAYIDLHGGDMIEALIPFTLFIEGDASSRELAEVFGIPLLVSTGPRGTTTAAGFQNGVPSILAESGGNGLWPEQDVAVLEQGVKRVMQHLGMLGGKPNPMPTRQLTQFAWLRAEQDGLWYPSVGAGAQIKAGQDIGRITDPFGQVLQPVISPIDGVTLFAVTSMAIGNGDPLYGIGA